MLLSEEALSSVAVAKCLADRDRWGRQIISLLATRLSTLSPGNYYSAVPRETLIEDNGVINLFGTIIVLERTNNCKTTIVSNKFPLRQNKAIKRGSIWYRHPALQVGRLLAGGLN